MTVEATAAPAEETAKVDSSGEAAPAGRDAFLQKIVEKYDSPAKEGTVKEEVAKEESPPVEEKKTSTSEESVAARLAKVAEREAQAERREKAAEAKEKAAAEREAKINKWKEDPLAAMEAAGTNFEEIAKAAIKHGEPETPEEKRDREQAEIKARLDAIDAAKAEAEAAKAQAKAEAENAEIAAAISDYQSRVASLIEEDSKSQSPQYELVATQGAQDLVYEITEAYWKKHQKILTPPQAAELAEGFLEKNAKKLIEAKKVKSWLQPAQKPTQKPTLSNSMQSFSAPTPEKPALDRDARLERAMGRLRYT